MLPSGIFAGSLLTLGWPAFIPVMATRLYDSTLRISMARTAWEFLFFPLPDEIRQNILSLSVFIDKHTVSALAEPSDRKLRVLVDINRNIAAGLMTSTEGAAAAAAEPARPAAVRGQVEGDVIA